GTQGEAQEGKGRQEGGGEESRVQEGGGKEGGRGKEGRGSIHLSLPSPLFVTAISAGELAECTPSFPFSCICFVCLFCLPLLRSSSAPAISFPSPPLR